MRPTADRSESVPYALAGLLADFDADALRATLADAAAVTTWTDATGNGNDIGNTGTNRPTFDYVNPRFNGHASVNFAKASTQYLFGADLPICTALSGSDVPLTVFVVVRRSTKISADEYVFTLGNSAQAAQSYLSGGYRYQNNNSQRVNSDVRDDAGTAATISTGQNEITDLGPQVLCWTFTGTQADIYVIGGSLDPLYDAAANTNGTGSDYSAQGAITFDRFSIGAQLRSSASRPCDLEVARVLVYDRALNASDRARVCEHLWNTYAPRVITSPADLPGLAHHWDASLLAAAQGADVDTWEDQVGSIDFAATGFDAPIVALHENGNKVVHFQGTDDALDSAAAADGNFLHDGSDYSLFVVYRVEAADEALQPILDTNGGSTTARGFSLAHDGASAAHSLQVKIGNGTTNVVNHDSQDYGSRPGAWHVAHVTHEGTLPSSEEAYQIWLDNEHYVAVDAANAEDAGDAAGAITLGKLAGAATFGTLKIAEIIVYDRKLGRPGESKLVHDYLARKWNTSHVALVGGNGLPNTLNDATPHRGFPGLCQDSRGTWHCVYRRGTTHGSSRGVAVHCTSADGIRWSGERVIYDIDDDDGRDFRSECGFIRLRQGAHAGRLLLTSKWSADDSNIQVTGVPSTLLVGYSDDHGGSWTWLDPLDGKTAYLATIDYTASPNGLIELQSGAFAGRILFTYTQSETGEGTGDQDLMLTYSDDGGLTWADPAVIVDHDAIAWRITESHIVEFASGNLLLLARDDTNKDIYSLHSTVSAPLTWGTLTNEFAGWGRPVCAVDPNDPLGVYCFYRSTATNLTSWRYSDDEGATWSAERALSNLHATTGTLAGSYATMSYCFPAVDSDGNLWLANGMEDGNDGDIFVRRWADAEA